MTVLVSYHSRLLNSATKHTVATFVARVTSCRTIAQPLSRRLPTAAARVRARVRPCGICGGQSGTGTGFLRVLRFPLPIHIPPIAIYRPGLVQ
jgi:hypothetical protein